MKPFHIGQRVRAHMRVNEGRDREGAPYTEIEGVVSEVAPGGQMARITVYRLDFKNIHFSGTFATDITFVEVLEQSGS